MLPVGAGTAFAEEDVFFFFFLRVEVGEFAGCFLTSLVVLLLFLASTGSFYGQLFLTITV